MSAVKFLQAFKNKSANEKEHLQHFDANCIIAHIYKVLIIVHDRYTLIKS